MNGPIKGKTFDLKKGVCTIGRSPDNDIQIMDDTVSRKHLKIFGKENEFFIKDLQSKNGTFVNGERVQAGVEIEVKMGVPLAVGRIFLHLREKPRPKDLARCSTGVSVTSFTGKAG